MNNEEISLSLWQGGMHVTLKVPKIVEQKAEEISHRSPTGTWDYMGLDLINQAYDELKAEGKLPPDEEKRSGVARLTERYAIPGHLRDIEHEYNVKVLLAVESGSRAWGFESGDSDWDVRFIYVHKPEWYLSVEDKHDVIEYMYPDDVDLAGWELRKALHLLRQTNPSLMEWLNSPKVYYIDKEFSARIKELAQQYFNPISSMYHYNHLYNMQIARHVQKDGYTAKRFLYYLRGILACKWIDEHLTLPPVPFAQLVDATIEDKTIRTKIDELIKLKKSGKECDMLVVAPELVEYARQLAAYYNECVGSFRPEWDKASSEDLDKLLYDMVQKYN